MYFTTNTTIDINKVLPAGSEVYVEDVVETFLQITVKNGDGIKVINPSILSSTLVNPTETTDGTITIAGVPLGEGVNYITVQKHDLADADSPVLQEIEFGYATVMKIANDLVAEVI